MFPHVFLAVLSDIDQKNVNNCPSILPNRSFFKGISANFSRRHVLVWHLVFPCTQNQERSLTFSTTGSSLADSMGWSNNGTASALARTLTSSTITFRFGSVKPNSRWYWSVNAERKSPCFSPSCGRTSTGCTINYPPPHTEYDLENKKSEKFENEGDFGFEFWMSLRGMGETYGAIGPVVSHVEKRRAGNLFPRKTVPNESAGANVRQLVDFPWDVRIIFRSKRVAVGLCLVLHDGRQRHTVGRENAGVLMDEDLFYAQRPGHIAWERWKKRKKKRKTKRDYLICRNKHPGCLIFRNNKKNSPKTNQSPSVSCTPPFEKSPTKTHRFYVLPPLKITDQKPSVLCTPPFEKSPIKSPSVLCTPPFEKSLFLVGAYFGWVFILGVGAYFDKYGKSTKMELLRWILVIIYLFTGVLSAGTTKARQDMIGGVEATSLRKNSKPDAVLSSTDRRLESRNWMEKIIWTHLRQISNWPTHCLICDRDKTFCDFLNAHLACIQNKYCRCQNIMLTNQSISESSKSINQLINRSINQSIGQSINQSIGQSINQSIARQLNQSLNQSINQSVNQSINQ